MLNGRQFSYNLFGETSMTNNNLTDNNWPTLFHKFNSSMSDCKLRASFNIIERIQYYLYAISLYSCVETCFIIILIQSFKHYLFGIVVNSILTLLILDPTRNSYIPLYSLE